MAAPHDDTCCRICSDVRDSIDRITRVLEIYGWMLDAYIVDFFRDFLWEKIPKSWANFLDGTSPEELGKWILKEPDIKGPWPLSLLALRKFIESVEISRDHRERISKFKCQSNARKAIKKKNERSSGNDEFDNVFNKHVKKKKRYEIDVLSRIAADCAEEADCRCVVDIGAGMGHLARVLTYKHNLHVTCVERDEALSETARKWDDQLVTTLSKHATSDIDAKKPQHVNLQVGVTETERLQLIKQLSNTFAESFDERNGSFGLIGLHPCGDLAATLLRLYANEDKARFICIVGCCYMKLSLSGETDRGFPMSQYMLKNNKYELIYAALEVACHAVEKHCDKLKTSDYGDLKVHAYRAILEYLIVEKNSSLRRAQLKSTKVKGDTTFKEYCDSVTENLDAKYRPTYEDTERSDVKGFLEQWKRVLIFGTLRLMIAPLVETLVLLDRFLYLSEMNLSVSIKAEFDSRVSPRNILLVSTKEKSDVL